MLCHKHYSASLLADSMLPDGCFSPTSTGRCLGSAWEVPVVFALAHIDNGWSAGANANSMTAFKGDDVNRNEGSCICFFFVESTSCNLEEQKR